MTKTIPCIATYTGISRIWTSFQDVDMRSERHHGLARQNSETIMWFISIADVFWRSIVDVSLSQHGQKGSD